MRLPETAANALDAAEDTPISISVAADGTVALGDQPIAKSGLIAAVRQAASGSEARIHVRGDRDATYETVVQVLGALNKAGFRNIGLVTEGSGPDFDEESE